MVGSREERRQEFRYKRLGQEVRVRYSSGPGQIEILTAKLLDVSEDGCGLELGSQLPCDIAVSVEGEIPGKDRSGPGTLAGIVVWCKREESGSYRVGVTFKETAGTDGRAEADAGWTETPSGSATDYYEVLQLSPNADQETINRVYRMQAQRYHPDNQLTGNAEMFRLILEAFRVLGNSERRAAYDATHQSVRRERWKIMDQAVASQGLDMEKAKRQGILALLYTKRATSPNRPGMSLLDLEELLGVPREHLEFSLWYLKESGLIHRRENVEYEITVKGADHAESSGPWWLKPERLIPEGQAARNE